MMQDSIITGEQHKEIIESLRNSSWLTLSYPLTHLEENAIEDFRHIANNLKKHAENKLPVEYEFTTNENRLSWLNYFDKSEMIGVEIPNEYSLHIIYILQIYQGWYKHHKNVVQSQFLEYANRLVSIEINGSTFIPSNCVDDFSEWYIRSNIGSLNFGLSLDIGEDNLYSLTIRVEYDFIQQIHTPMVLQRHLGQFFNEESENYLFPISTPQEPAEVGKKKAKAGRPPKDELSKEWQKDLRKEYQRLTETNEITIKINKAKERLINVTFKDKFKHNSFVNDTARLNTILRAK